MKQVLVFRRDAAKLAVFFIEPNLYTRSPFYIMVHAMWDTVCVCICMVHIHVHHRILATTIALVPPCMSRLRHFPFLMNATALE